MSVSLSMLSRGSANFPLHCQSLIGTVLAGASSQFWHGEIGNAQRLRLGIRREQKLQKFRQPARCQNYRLCSSGKSACLFGLRNASRNQVFDSMRNPGWNCGILNHGHSRSTVRASSSGSLGKKSSSKTKLVFICENCGETFAQWWGACKNCKEMNTVKEFREPVQSSGPGGGAAARAVDRVNMSKKMAQDSWDANDSNRGKGAWLKNENIGPQRLPDVAKAFSKQHWRLALPGDSGAEVSRVLGGGVVPGSLILVGGDPGVGKSTLLLQIAGLLALGSQTQSPAPVLYISGEESVEQISNRADRMKISANELFLYSATDLELVLKAIQDLNPRAVVVDSIQTVYLPESNGSAGSVTQVRECAAAMLRLAKQTSIPIFLVGHVTKTGDIAGPRVLEHIVDVVLYMEGERLQSHRLLRVVKNRYGSSDEVGVFAMVEGGLDAITNPSALFLSERSGDSNSSAAAAVAVTMEGSRPILLEVQALCCPGSGNQGGRRTSNGVDNQRLCLLLAVLTKQAGFKLQNQDVFINVVGGLQLREPASDVAIAVAICSSYLEKSVPRDVAFVGEIGLGGEIRSVGQLERRVSEAAKLGFKTCIVPKSAVKSAKSAIKNITIIPCADIAEVLEKVLCWPENGTL